MSKGPIIRGWRNRLASRSWRTVDAIDRRFGPPRVATTLWLVAWGVFLVLGSWAIGIDSMSAYPANPFSVHDLPRPGTPREVGFLAAPNWSLTSVFVWPAMFYVLRALIDSAECVFDEIDRSPMAWMARPGELISATWARHRRYIRRSAVLALVVGITLSIGEWWKASARALLCGKAPLENERDWSAIRAGTDGIDHVVQAAFSLSAFLYQGVAIALLLTFAATVILIARTMGLHAAGTASPPLLIDIESNDPGKRAGFERFVVVIDYMIVFVALAFANFFMTRIQNAYLRDRDHSSIMEFVQQDFIVRELKDVEQLFTLTGTDLSSSAVGIGAVLVLFQCFFFFNATLRHAALQARNRSDHELVRGVPAKRAEETGLQTEAVRTRLREANVWPLGYSDLMPTLSFLTIAALTILYYRIGLYLVFLWIAGWIIARAAGGLIKGR